MLAEFQHSVEHSSIDTAILLYRQALRQRPTGDPNRLSTLTALSFSLVLRFQLLNRLEDVDEAVDLSHEALYSLPYLDAARYRLIINRCANLLTRFGHAGEPQDVFDASDMWLEAEKEDQEASELFTSGTAMAEAFQECGDLSQLEEGISLLYTSLRLRPAPHPLRSQSLGNLGTTLAMRFRQKGQLEDLEESMVLHREALHLRPAPHPLRSGSLNKLATTLAERFGQKSQLTDLEDSIDLHREALHLRPASHPDRSISLNNLAHALFGRFERKGQLADLEETIILFQEASHLFPVSHPDRPISLNNLAGALSRRFEHKGRLADLEDSMVLHREALHLRPAPHPDRSISLNNLAHALFIRFEEEGKLTDLEESIILHQEALRLFPTSHPDRSGSLNNLAIALSRRFEQKRQLADLENSIVLYREASHLRPAPHPLRYTSLNNLANALSVRFVLNGQLADLEDSIVLYREVLHLEPAPHPHRSRSLNNLANTLSTRFEQKGQLADLEDSITLYREALHLRPAPHPDRSTLLQNLANRLSTRFEQEGQLADLEESMSAFRNVTTSTMGSVITRFRSSRNWASRSAAFNHSSTLEAYQHATDLLPRLASLDKSLKARYQALSEARGLAGDACAFAIRIGQLKKAVEFISAGRTVFWSQALHLRTPLDELEADEPELASKLRTIADTLERASLVDGSQIVDANSQLVRDMEKDTSRYRELDEEWHRVLAQVRSHEKFKHFLQPKSFLELQHSARNGPVVILNASESGCDGLLITRDDVHHVPFPALTRQYTHELAVDLRQALSYNMTSLASTAADAIYDGLCHSIQAMGPDARKGSKVPDKCLDSEDIFRIVLRKLWVCVAQPVIQALKLQVGLTTSAFLFFLSTKATLSRNRTCPHVCGGVPQAPLPSSQSTQPVSMILKGLNACRTTQSRPMLPCWKHSSLILLSQSIRSRCWLSFSLRCKVNPDTACHILAKSSR